MLNVPIGPFCGNELQPTHPIGSEDLTLMRTWSKTALAIAFVLALVPSAAFASDENLQPGSTDWASAVSAVAQVAADEKATASTPNVISQYMADVSSEAADAMASAIEKTSPAYQKQNKILAYDQADLAAIGSQEESAHTICCPSYACAYADAVLDGTVRGHDYYTCSCCSWTDWGGGNSSFRCVGSDEQLLREAYDQISAGKPTVIHVTWSGGEHWIALIGYENAVDPDHLTLSNFIALDPWDGAQLNAGSKYALYGDGCEHISER